MRGCLMSGATPSQSGTRTYDLKVTTSKKKSGFLLIETFRKRFNPQNYGHQGSILGGLSCSAELGGRRDEEPNKMVECK